MADPHRRVGFALGAVDKILGRRVPAVQGFSSFAHSAGCELGAADGGRRTRRRRARRRAGRAPGCGTAPRPRPSSARRPSRRDRRACGICCGSRPTCIRAEVLTGALSAPGVAYEAEVTANWPRRDFPEWPPRCAVPVEFSVADHERVWESTPEALTPIAALFTSSPRVVVNEMPDSGHNLSVGLDRGRLPPAGVVVRRGMHRRADGERRNWRRVDACRIHRTG